MKLSERLIFLVNHANSLQKITLPMPESEINLTPEYKVTRCRSDAMRDALSLIFHSLTKAQRKDMVDVVVAANKSGEMDTSDLFVAERGEETIGAIWLQKQPGKTAILWPPGTHEATDADQIAASERIKQNLLNYANKNLDSDGITLTQVLLSQSDLAQADLLVSAGYFDLTDLVYLMANTSNTEDISNETLVFEPYEDSQLDRLKQIIQQTYVQSLDCPGMEGARNIQDVIDGYKETGEYAPERWFFVQAEGNDVGVLLLTEHSAANQWELIYMGVMPDGRGHGYGKAIASKAIQLAAKAGADRIVLAVDGNNAPACDVYATSGYIEWDRRKVLIRRLGGKS